MSQFFVTRTACPACNNNSAKVIYSLPYADERIQSYLRLFYEGQGFIELDYLEGAEYILKECDRCKLIYQEQVPGELLMHKLYEEWIDPKLALERSLKMPIEQYLYDTSQIINIIRNFQKPPSEISILDFGMGWGKFCMLANAFGCNAYGMELSTHRIDYAKQKGVSVLTWEELEQQKFDFIYSADVFEHISNPKELLRRLCACLRPDGVVCLNVPNGLTASKIIKKMNWTAIKGSKDNINIVSPLEHINCYLPLSLKLMAEACNLKEIKWNRMDCINYNKSGMIDYLRKKYHLLFKIEEPTCLFFKLQTV